jgi:hypothetical protein
MLRRFIILLLAVSALLVARRRRPEDVWATATRSQGS